MKDNPFLKGTVIRTLFVILELIGLAVISVIAFSNDGTGNWGYWGSIFVIFVTLSPVILYVIASAVFNAFNLSIVLRRRHTAASIRKYYKLSLAFLIMGILACGMYGLPVLFLPENLFLFLAYNKEYRKIKDAKAPGSPDNPINPC